MSSTILPNIWTNLRYASQAKRSLEVCEARPWTLSSFKPRLRTVSIIPGMENFAPERTETNSGSVGSPSFFPMASSSRWRCSSVSSMRPEGKAFSFR